MTLTLSHYLILAAVLFSISIAGIVIRTALEDMTLRAKLDGYEQYTARVRYRLIPGIW